MHGQPGKADPVTAAARWLDEHAGDIAHIIGADDEEVLRVLAECADFEPDHEEDEVGAARAAEAAVRLAALPGIAVHVGRLRQTLARWGYTAAVAQ